MYERTLQYKPLSLAPKFQVIPLTCPQHLLIRVSQSTSCYDRLNYWRSLKVFPEYQEYVGYGCDQSMQTNAGALIGWRDLDHILE